MPGRLPPLLEIAVGVVCSWLPLFASIGRQLRACEEAYCDAVVIARLLGGERYTALFAGLADQAELEGTKPLNEV